MQITVFSVWMTILWSSALILIFYFLRKKRLLIEVCSVSGVIILYLFCILRMFVPIELPWTIVVGGGQLYNNIFDFFELKIIKNININQLLVIIWIIGAVLLLQWIYHQYFNVYRFFGRMSATKDDNIERILKQVAGENGFIPNVIKIPGLKIPSCLGIIHKQIIIPDKEYTDKELYCILLHEYVHLKNNDILTKTLINVLCAIYWWNPIVYLLRRDMDQSLELRCDAEVINNLTGVERSDYLEIMLNTFKDSVGAKEVLQVKNVSMRMLDTYFDKLLERIDFITEENKIGKNKVIAWIISACVLLASYSFILQPKYAPSMNEIVIDKETKMINNNEAYIVRYKDGTYSLYLGEVIEINEETVSDLLKGGIKIVEE